MSISTKNLRYVFDLDGTICEERPVFEKSMAKPSYDVIKSINALHDNGRFIIIYTARGWPEYAMTERWLKDQNIKYDLLMCGKPVYDVWVDDRAININDYLK